MNTHNDSHSTRLAQDAATADVALEASPPQREDSEDGVPFLTWPKDYAGIPYSALND